MVQLVGRIIIRKLEKMLALQQLAIKGNAQKMNEHLIFNFTDHNAFWCLKMQVLVQLKY